ncbi:CCHC-type domain-containing protein, partial [Podarcis lilfordi]
AMAEQAAALVALAQENQALNHTVQQLSDAVVALQQRLEALPAPGADARLRASTQWLCLRNLMEPRPAFPCSWPRPSCIFRGEPGTFLTTAP